MQESPVKLDDAFILSWNNVSKANNLFVSDIIDNLISNSKKIIINKFASFINADVGLVKFDEKIYEYYKRIIDYYIESINIFNKNKDEIQSKNILKILEGLFSVLNSQVRFFWETHSLNEFKKSDEKNLNPIFLEKKKIIEKNIKIMSDEVDKLKSKLVKEDSENFFNYILTNIYNEDIFNNINNYYVNKYKDEIFNIYSKGCLKAFKQLNDMESRKVVKFYFDVLKEERDNLLTVVKVQIDALENEIQTRDEEVIIQKILSELRECYQYTEKNIFDLEKHIHDTKNKGSFDLPAGRFDKIMIIHFDEKYTRFIDLEGLFEDFKINFNNALKQNLINCLCQILGNVDNLKNSADCILKLTDDLIDSFNFTVFNYERYIPETVDIDYDEIVKGVADTLKIKIESLKESKDDFVKEMDKFINSYKSDSINYNDDEFNSFSGKMLDKFIISGHGKDFFSSDLLNHTKKFFSDKIDKKLNLRIESLNKKILRYEKESLLYEITTFEEILCYSISRLRKSENELIVRFVRDIDRLNEKLTLILNKYNIEKIIPNPHEMFNGKEQEVLLTEKNNSFKKGEIIKVMNCGFKKGDVVILRANVIAAR